MLNAIIYLMVYESSMSSQSKMSLSSPSTSPRSPSSKLQPESCVQVQKLYFLSSFI